MIAAVPAIEGAGASKPRSVLISPGLAIASVTARNVAWFSATLSAVDSAEGAVAIIAHPLRAPE